MTKTLGAATHELQRGFRGRMDRPPGGADAAPAGGACGACGAAGAIQRCARCLKAVRCGVPAAAFVLYSAERRWDRRRGRRRVVARAVRRARSSGARVPDGCALATWRAHSGCLRVTQPHSVERRRGDKTLRAAARVARAVRRARFSGARVLEDVRCDVAASRCLCVVQLYTAKRRRQGVVYSCVLSVYWPLKGGYV